MYSGAHDVDMRKSFKLSRPQFSIAVKHDKPPVTRARERLFDLVPGERSARTLTTSHSHLRRGLAAGETEHGQCIP